MFDTLLTGDMRRMDELHPVTFRFADGMEVHYLSVVPEAGDLVTHGRDVWVVATVKDDGVGTVVACQRRDGPATQSSDDGV